MLVGGLLGLTLLEGIGFCWVVVEEPPGLLPLGDIDEVRDEDSLGSAPTLVDDGIGKVMLIPIISLVVIDMVDIVGEDSTLLELGVGILLSVKTISGEPG